MGEARFALSRGKEEVSQVRDSRAAKVSKAEAHNRGLGVLVTGSYVIIVIVSIGANLNTPEGDLSSGIDVTEPGGANEGINVFGKGLVPGACKGIDSCCKN